MEMEEKIHINEEELMEQMKQEMIDSEKYVRCEIVVSVGSQMPYTNVEISHCTVLEIGMFLITLEAIHERIRNEYPEAVEVRKNLGIKTFWDSDNGMGGN